MLSVVRKIDQERKSISSRFLSPREKFERSAYLAPERYSACTRFCWCRGQTSRWHRPLLAARCSSARWTVSNRNTGPEGMTGHRYLWMYTTWRSKKEKKNQSDNTLVSETDNKRLKRKLIRKFVSRYFLPHVPWDFGQIQCESEYQGCARQLAIVASSARLSEKQIGPCYKEAITRIVTMCISRWHRFTPRAGRRVILFVCVHIFVCCVR